MIRKHWLAIPAVLLFFWLALNSLVADSPTMDEQNHLARGLAFLRTGDPRLSLEHPPLVNVLSAAPLLTLENVRLPTDHPSWSRPEGWYEFADLLLWGYNDDVGRMIFLARLPIVFLTLGLALTGYHFSRKLWGHPAPMFAFYFLLFDPNLMAHGRYTTTDVGGTTFLFLAALLLWQLWQAPRPDYKEVLAAALGLGLAFGSKLSTLVFGPIFVVMALLPLYSSAWSGGRAARRLGKLLVAGGGSLLVVWALFGFQWGSLQFRSQGLSTLNDFSAPMPTFWAGIEQILLLSGGGRPAFLLGETSTEGFAAYFPVAFLVKTPLPTLLLIGLAFYVLLRPAAPQPRRRRALFLTLPAVLYFLASMQSNLNLGYRHLLPTLPFLYTIVAGAAATILQQETYAMPWQMHRLATCGLALWLLLATLSIHPHYLSFFNPLAGGPQNGYKILVDSNVDWGQDLLRLRRWMNQNEVDHLRLSWFGTADPTYYDISYEPLPGLPRHFNLWWDVPFDPSSPEPGVYAISASNLWELPLQEEKYVFPWFRAREPDDRVGYSILIYDVP